MASWVTAFGGPWYCYWGDISNSRTRGKRIDLTSIEHHNEIMKLLESLMADKEALRKSNTELQELLSESRETLQALQEEEGERLASSPEGGIGM